MTIISPQNIYPGTNLTPWLDNQVSARKQRTLIPFCYKTKAAYQEKLNWNII